MTYTVYFEDSYTNGTKCKTLAEAKAVMKSQAYNYYKRIKALDDNDRIIRRIAENRHKPFWICNGYKYVIEFYPIIKVYVGINIVRESKLKKHFEKSLGNQTGGIYERKNKHSRRVIKKVSDIKNPTKKRTRPESVKSVALKNAQKASNVRNAHKYIVVNGKKKYVGSRLKPSELFLYEYSHGRGASFPTETYKRTYSTNGKAIIKKLNAKGLKITLKKVRVNRKIARIPFIESKVKGK